MDTAITNVEGGMSPRGAVEAGHPTPHGRCLRPTRSTALPPNARAGRRPTRSLVQCHRCGVVLRQKLPIES